MKLNDRSVTSTSPALPAGKTDFVFFDEDIPGFGLRVRASGARSWVFQFWLGEKNRKITIGKWPKISAKQAREMASEAAAKVGLGRDPQTEKENERSRKLTVGEVVDSYLEFKAKELRPRSLIEVKRHLESHAKPLHGTPIKALTREQVADLLRAVAKASGPVGSNRVRASLSALLSWAVRDGKAETNVAAFTNKEAEASRDRVLSNDELATIWSALGDDDFSAITKILLLTGQRRDEIGGLRWSEIELSKKVINLPALRTKNGRAHTVPLSEPVVQIIKGIRKTAGRDFVFGEGEGPFSGFAKCKARLDSQLPDMLHWTLHDLRRTMSTHMHDDKLSIQPHVVEAVINHVSGHRGGVAGVYNRARYEVAKREALDKWAAHVLQILARHKSALKVA
jgi:integrase